MPLSPRFRLHCALYKLIIIAVNSEIEAGSQIQAAGSCVGLHASVYGLLIICYHYSTNVAIKRR